MMKNLINTVNTVFFPYFQSNERTEISQVENKMIPTHNNSNSITQTPDNSKDKPFSISLKSLSYRAWTVRNSLIYKV